MLKKGLITFVICIVVSMVSCVKVDDTLGDGMIPDDGRMEFTADTLTGFNAYTSTVDSIITSMSSSALLGNTLSPYWGDTDLSFISTYLRYGGLNPHPDTLWGLNPKIDSVKFVLSSNSRFGTSDLPQRVTINKITKAIPRLLDTMYSNFDPTGYFDPIPVAVFNTRDTTVSRVSLDIDFAKPFLDTTGGVYTNDSLFMARHLGLMISTDRVLSGGSYDEINLTNTGIEIYYHNSNLIKPDTLVAFFSMFRTNVLNSNSSFTMINRDFTKADPVLGVDLNKVDTEQPQEITYAQGFAGLLTKVNLKKEFFDDIKEKAKAKGFSNIVISNATLRVPLYQPTPAVMSRSLQRLGAYSSFQTEVLLTDYFATLEPESQNQEPTSYGGQLNRVKEHYDMDITTHIQSIFVDTSTDDEDVEDNEESFDQYMVELTNEITNNYNSAGSTFDAKNIELHLKYIMLK